MVALAFFFLGWISIRLIFSIADIQTAQEAQFEQMEEGEEGSEDEPAHSYPIRCSIAINKVCLVFKKHDNNVH
jgi:hypothetical protein